LLILLNAVGRYTSSSAATIAYFVLIKLDAILDLLLKFSFECI